MKRDIKVTIDFKTNDYNASCMFTDSEGNVLDFNKLKKNEQSEIAATLAQFAILFSK